MEKVSYKRICIYHLLPH